MTVFSPASVERAYKIIAGLLFLNYGVFIAAQTCGDSQIFEHLGMADPNRVAYYRDKIRAASEVLEGRFGFYAPEGGFFLWLDVGDGEAAAVTLWREAGLRVLPGSYMAAAENAGRGAVGGTDPSSRSE